MLPGAALAFLFTVGAALAPVGQARAPAKKVDCFEGSDNTTLNDFSFKDVLEQQSVALSKYRGHVVLVVNVATY